MTSYATVAYSRHGAVRADWSLSVETCFLVQH